MHNLSVVQACVCAHSLPNLYAYWLYKKLSMGRTQLTFHLQMAGPTYALSMFRQCKHSCKMRHSVTCAQGASLHSRRSSHVEQYVHMTAAEAAVPHHWPDIVGNLVSSHM